MPITVTAGLFQMRLRIVPSPIGEVPGSRPASSRSVSSAYSGVVGVALGHPLDGDGAVVVPERRQHLDGRHHRVGHRSAEHAGVRCMVQSAHAHGEPRVPSQRDGQAGRHGVPVAGVGDHDGVGAQRVLVVGRNCANEREPYSSSPSMNIAIPSSRSSPSTSATARIEAMCAMMPGLVVCRTATVQATVAHGRLERRRLPQRVVSGRLHVVVRVQQDRRLAVAGGARGEHRGLPVLVGAGDRRAQRSAPRRRHRCPSRARRRPRRCARAASGRMPARPCRGCARGDRGR